MQAKPIIWLVGTKYTPAKGKELSEKEFNDWYNRVDIPWMLSVPGVTSAKRYEVISDEPQHPDFPLTGEEYPKYLAVYELESAAVLDSIYNDPKRSAVRKARFRIPDEDLFLRKWRVMYKPIAL